MARIAIDIDSTLHHYWDLLEEVARRRFGVALPYDRQLTWGITLLEQEQVAECVRETHSDANILAGEPYPGAVETVNAWHETGHFIHITSHRAVTSDTATRRWLQQIGLAYDDLHCSYDKVTRCVELGIDLLIDDSPVNLVRARDRGIAGATIAHPWNTEIVASDGVTGAADWRELRQLLRPRVPD